MDFIIAPEDCSEKGTIRLVILIFLIFYNLLKIILTKSAALFSYILTSLLSWLNLIILNIKTST